MTNVDKYRGMSDNALGNEILALRRELFGLRMARANTSQAPKPDRFKRARRDIARIKTVLNERRREVKSNG